MRLGVPFRVTGTVDEFRVEVARRVEELNKSRGLKRDAPVPVDELARIRTAVAGFDLTFSPPKSVGTLWAVADPTVSARIEVAHQQAVQEALRFIDRRTAAG